MDYVQEDVDSMRKELELWRKENKEHSLALADAQRCGLASCPRPFSIALLVPGLGGKPAHCVPSGFCSETEDALQPLRARLGDLQQQIEDKEEQIFAVRQTTYANAEKIQVCGVSPMPPPCSIPACSGCWGHLLPRLAAGALGS